MATAREVEPNRTRATCRGLGIAALLGALGLILAPPSPGAGQTPDRASYSDRFTTEEPGSPTGRDLKVRFFDPADPGAKPPSVRRIELELHPGARWDTTAIAQCPASDAELVLLGDAACPPESRVGTDEILLDTGLLQPARFIVTDFSAFNNQGELILLGAIRDLELVHVPLRARIAENRMTIDEVPFLPGTLPDGAAIRRERATFDARTGTRDGNDVAYLTTPPSCPPSGHWTNRVTYTFRDGVRQTLASHSPCLAPARALRLRVSAHSPQRSLRRLVARVRCQRVDCRASARARILIARPGAAARVFNSATRKRSRRLAAGEPWRLRAPIVPRVRRAARAALRNGGSVTAWVRARARATRDPGVSRSSVQRVRIRR